VDATEMRMLRYIHGIRYEDHVRNEDIRSQAKVREISVEMRKKRLQWFGHVQRRDEKVDIKRVCEMRVEGKRKRGRPKRRWMDTINDDMKRCSLTREDTDDRVRWSSLIELGSLRNGHPSRTTAV